MCERHVRGQMWDVPKCCCEAGSLHVVAPREGCMGRSRERDRSGFVNRRPLFFSQRFTHDSESLSIVVWHRSRRGIASM